MLQKSIRFVCLLLALSFHTPAHAEKGEPSASAVPVVAIFPDGIYKDAEVPSESAPDGKLKIKRLELPTRYIPAQPGVTFGHVLFVSSTGPEANLEVILKTSHPPFKNSKGEIETGSSQRSELNVGKDNFGIVSNLWDFLEGYEYEFVPGEWRFETIINGVIIHSCTFEIGLEALPARFPISVENRWGFIDRQGVVRVEPQFESLGRAEFGIAEFSRDGKCGFIDTQGNVVIPPTYPRMLFRSVSSGLIPVKIEESYGYITSSGKVKIEPRFDNATPFHEGLANVLINKLWGYIDATGAMVIEPRFLHSSNFFDGFAQITVEGKSGYIDRTGTFVIPPKYESAGSFRNGLAPVLIDRKWGFINTKGELVIPATFSRANPFSEGSAAVHNGESWGFIDRNGNWSVPAQFEEVGNFSGGLAAVRKDKRWGYIDQKGKWVLRPVLSLATQFSDGVAMIAFQPGDWGYLDTTGKLVWGAKRKPGFQPETDPGRYKER